MFAIVTGANRGIGAEVAQQLAASGHEVLASSREGSGPHRLDLADSRSVEAFTAGIDALDVLVNNAATSFDGFDTQVARSTLAVNFVATVALTEALLPKIRTGGRIVMVSSGMGELSGFSGEARRALEDPAADRASLLALGERFVAQVASGEHRAFGWPSSAYSASKALLNAYVRHLERRLAHDPRKIKVIAVCPGWVRTRMGGSAAPRSVEQGVKGIVWAASSSDVPDTGFFRDAHPIPW